MPEIVGKFVTVNTSLSPIEAHLSHLRYLSNVEVARRTLRDRFELTAKQSRDIGEKVGAHLNQGLEFYAQSLLAPYRVRPVLQYYCYLNLAVAVILAYRPPKYERYRHHGVEDRSHRLRNLDLSSILVRARNGAVPIFHTLLSDEPIQNRHFRLNELAGSIPSLSHELFNIFGLRCELVCVSESVSPDDKRHWRSHISLECFCNDGSSGRLTRQRVERAMPGLVSYYVIKSQSNNKLEYTSRRSWPNESRAQNWHRQMCMKFINFGGHGIFVGHPLEPRVMCQYQWETISRKPLLPTLTAVLLLSFGLASISRYRPILARRAEDSALNLLFDVFVHESDSIMIPAIRNLLFREELCVSQTEGL
jgi:hypothetical protein